MVCTDDDWMTEDWYLSQKFTSSSISQHSAYVASTADYSVVIGCRKKDASSRGDCLGPTFALSCCTFTVSSAHHTKKITSVACMNISIFKKDASKRQPSFPGYFFMIIFSWLETFISGTNSDNRFLYKEINKSTINLKNSMTKSSFNIN